MFILRMTNEVGMKKLYISDSYNKIEKFIHDNYNDIVKLNELTFRGFSKDEKIIFQIELCEVLE